MKPATVVALALVACAGSPENKHESHPVVVASASGAPEKPLAPAPRTIPNTDVPDEPENRDIIEFCERYRKATEAQDVEALLALVSPSYRDHDMDYEELRKWLQSQAKKADQIRYEIRYRSITRRAGRIVVGFTYSASYRLAGETFSHKVDDTELVLEKHAGSYLILSGM